MVAEAGGQYATALGNTEANLRAYQVAAGILADAAEQIARLFANSDLNAAHGEVQDVINGAVWAATEGLTCHGGGLVVDEIISLR